MAKPSGKNSNSDSGFAGLLSGFLSAILGGSDIEREKRRQLKIIKKELKKRSKFYKINGDQAQPGLAYWFYDIYKIVGSSAGLLEKYGSSDVLKNFIIEHFFSDQIRETAASLEPENIKKSAVKNSDIKKTSEQVKEALVQIFSALDAETIKKINSIYGALNQLKDLVSFQYYFMLKKFDSMLPEKDFVYKPKFSPISGEYIKEDLIDFLDVLYSLNPGEDWDTLFDILKKYRDMDVISRQGWKKVLQYRKEILKTKTLNLIVQLLSEDPLWKPRPEFKNFDIVEEYYSRLKTLAENTIQEIVKERRGRQAESLLVKLFGTPSVVRTQYYTDRENLTFHKKMLDGYLYVDAINYLKAFFLDYYKSNVRVLVDLLLIQGKWATKISSQQFSNSYRQLLDLSDQLLAFDASLSDESGLGSRIKRFLRQSTRDKSALINLRTILESVNGDAKKIINASAQNFIQLGKNIRMLMDEYKNNGQEIIINWKEVDSWADPPVYDQMNEIYTKFYYLIQLLQLVMKK